MLIIEKSPETTAKTEREFEDFVRHGDDFYKIELWRPAKAWYKKALALGINSEHVKWKIAECDRLLAYEVKVIWILVAIAAFIVFVVLLF